MKADTALDYVEFQLSTHRNRCELFVAGNGATEKLASGFLKPFLVHLRAVRDRVTSQNGDECVVRLDHPQNLSINATSWFTKGVIERFVRFVSTPEVLERVGSIEDELIQLEQVRSIQVSTLNEDGGASLSPYPGSTNNYSRDSAVKLEDNAVCKLSNGYAYKSIDCAATASKMELLEAMDIRLRALKEEQDTYFSRAAGAGFDSGSMAGLIAFAEYFGAERLSAACLNFLQVLQTRHLEQLELDPEETSTSMSSATAIFKTAGNTSVMERESFFQSGVVIPRGLKQKANCCSEELEDNTYSSSLKCSVTVEGRKRWGPTENICRKVFLEQAETDSMASNDKSGRGTLEDMADDAQSCSTHAKTCDLPEDKSANRRNPCLLEKYAPERHEIRRSGSVTESHKLKNCQEQQHKQDRIVEGSNREEHMCNENSMAPVKEQARRLSVQDAISLFEKNQQKQRRDSIDSGGKLSCGKQDRGRVSLEGPCATFSAEMVTRRRSTLNVLETMIKSQENHSSFKEKEPSLSLQNAILSAEGASCLENSSGNTSNQTFENDQRNQFKLQLERTLSKESSTRDLAIKEDIRKRDPGQEIAQNLADFDLHAASTCLTSSKMVTSLKSTATARQGACEEPRETLYVHDDPTTKGDQFVGCVDSSKMRSTLYFDSFRSDPKNAVGNKEDEGSKSSDDANKGTLPGNESDLSGETSAQSIHLDMKALAEMVENQNRENDCNSCGLKGRYYDQYTRLRDAKLMEGQDTKRAERDAKLRSMEETLIKGKAEMDARAAKVSRNVHNQSRTMKLQALKDDHSEKLDQKKANNVCGSVVSGDQRNGGTSSHSQPVTPHAIKEEITTSRIQNDRKFGTAQKGITHPHISTRSNYSISPTLTCKSTTGSMVIPRRSTVTTNATENPLGRSVPNLNLTNFRKNPKPSTVRQSSSARVHPKNGGNEAREATHGDVNISHTSDRSTKNKNHSRSNVMRKSCVVSTDLKVLSTSSDDGTLRQVKSQRDLGTNPKLRKSVGGAFQESKQLLRKGPSGEPGTRSRVTRNRMHCAVKSCDGGASTEIEQSIVTDEAHKVTEDMNNSANLGHGEIENMETDATNDADTSPGSGSGDDDVEMQVVGSGVYSSDEPEEKLEMSSANVLMASSPQGQTLLKGTDGNESSCNDNATIMDMTSLLDTKVLTVDSEDLAMDSSRKQTDVNDATFQNSSWIPELPALLPTSSLIRSGTGSGHLSPISVASLDSPIHSPTWNSFQTQYSSESNTIQLNKESAGSPKLLTTMKQPKEQVKGFKRLLKFGRKTRNSEAANADGGFSISEGGDDSEEQGRTPDEYSSSRGRFQHNRTGNRYNLQEQRSFQDVRSSIPVPPANFRLREEHLSGGTMLKAPWSFFSLSALRSKGNESKPR